MASVILSFRIHLSTALESSTLQRVYELLAVVDQRACLLVDSDQTFFWPGKSTWLPAGEWMSWDGAQVYTGPVVVTNDYGRSDIPLFVRVGAVVPMKTMSSVVATSPNPLVWMVAMPPRTSARKRVGVHEVSSQVSAGQVHVSSFTLRFVSLC